MNINTGGPAFPQTNDRVIASRSIAESQGMTLRDYFAAKAMQSIITREGQDALVVEDITFTAYQYADAMLKQREVGNA